MYYHWSSLISDEHSIRIVPELEWDGTRHIHDDDDGGDDDDEDDDDDDDDNGHFFLIHLFMQWYDFKFQCLNGIWYSYNTLSLTQIIYQIYHDLEPLHEQIPPSNWGFTRWRPSLFFKGVKFGGFPNSWMVYNGKPH